MKVSLTQFLLPDGRQRIVETTIHDRLAGQVAAIHDRLAGQVAAIEECGARLTAEMLTTGEVSMTVEHPKWGDFDIEVVNNGPEVPIALERLIERFEKSSFEHWKASKSD